MKKNAMRRNMITRLRGLPKTKREAIEQSLSEQLLKSDLWKQAKVIGITHATTLEWATIHIIKQGWQEGKKVTMPTTSYRDKTMNFYVVHDWNELHPGHANILEPKPFEGQKVWNQEIDLLIVPGLMFDRHGYRLGFGGGFYDRYLAGPEHAAITVSLVAEFQLVAKLPTDLYDIPVDYIITEHACIRTKL